MQTVVVLRPQGQSALACGIDPRLRDIDDTRKGWKKSKRPNLRKALSEAAHNGWTRRKPSWRATSASPHTHPPRMDRARPDT